MSKQADPLVLLFPYYLKKEKLNDLAMNKLQEFTNEQLQTELLKRKKCEFNKPNCQKKASHWLAKRLGGWEIQRNPICTNCKNYIEKALLERTNELINP